MTHVACRNYLPGQGLTNGKTSVLTSVTLRLGSVTSLLVSKSLPVAVRGSKLIVPLSSLISKCYREDVKCTLILCFSLVVILGDLKMATGGNNSMLDFDSGSGENSVENSPCRRK